MTHKQKILQKWPQGIPFPTRLSLMRHCLWKSEVGPWPEFVTAALLATADTWRHRLQTTSRAGLEQVHAIAIRREQRRCHSPHGAGRPATHEGAGLRPSACPPQVRPSLPTEFCLGFRGVCSPQVCLFFFKLQMQGKPPDIMRAGQTLTLKDSWAGLQVKSYA